MRHTPLGEALRAAREAAGRSIADVAARTNVRAEYLRALEEGDYSGLPERPFVRGYLQRYAAELGLDPAPLLAEFDRALPARPELTARAPAPRPRGVVLPIGPIVLGVLALGIVGGLGWWGVTLWQARGVAATPAAPVPAPEPAAAPASRRVNLTVESTPVGAKVYLDNRYLGQTPVRSFPLEARADGELRVELAGHKTAVGRVALNESRRLGVQLRPAAGEAASVIQIARPPGVPAPKTNAGTPKTNAGTPKANAGTPVAAPSPAPTPAPEPTPKPAVQESAAPKPAAPKPAVSAAASGITLRFSGRSWVRVTSSGGQVLYEGIPAVGSSRTFPAGVVVRAGSAGAVLVAGANGAGTPLGASGQVVERRFP